MNEIEFECPNCQQPFKSATYQDGMECTCQQCNFTFTILAKPAEPSISAQRISAPQPSFAGKAAAILNTDLLGDEDKKRLAAAEEPAEKREIRQLFESASTDSGIGTFLLVVAMISFVIGLIAAANDASPAAFAVLGAITGGSLMIGLACKLLAQLVLVSALTF
jgi:DNA-directed RNA polymerase subunit RPC12/RpoP